MNKSKTFRAEHWIIWSNVSEKKLGQFCCKSESIVVSYECLMSRFVNHRLYFNSTLIIDRVTIWDKWDLTRIQGSREMNWMKWRSKFSEPDLVMKTYLVTGSVLTGQDLERVSGLCWFLLRLKYIFSSSDKNKKNKNLRNCEISPSLRRCLRLTIPGVLNSEN